MTDDTTPTPLDDAEDDETARLLRHALNTEAEMVQPTDRLTEITARTDDGGRRPWWIAALAAVGGVAAAALVATLVFGLGRDDATAPIGPPPASQPSDPTPSEPAPSEPSEPAPSEPAPSEPPAGTGEALPVYWVGEQGSRFGLFREFTSAGPQDPAERVQAAVSAALGGSPSDPDYISPWGEGAAATTSVADGQIGIDLNVAAASRSVGSEVAVLAVQQLVWTATAAAQQDVPVRFTVDGEAADLFGTVSTSDPISRGSGADDPRALVWITSPTEGGAVDGDAPDLRGEGVNAFENTLNWRIEQDGTVVDEGFFGVVGTDGQPVDTGRRGTWTLDPDQALEPGSYTLTVEVPDASGGESTVRSFDTKAFTVR